MADARRLMLGMPMPVQGNPSIANFPLNATAAKLVFIFASQTTAPIATLSFRQGSITGTSPAYRVSLQGVDSSGNEDGTVKGGGSPCSATFTPAAANNTTWRRAALANAYTPTRGELLAMVIEYSSGTCNGSNFCSFGQVFGNSVPWDGLPTAIGFDGTTRARQAAAPIFGYETASAVFGVPVSAMSNLAFASPVEWAMKFTVPTNFGGTFQVSRAWFQAILPAADSVAVTLYQGGLTTDKTALQTVTLDTDLFSSGSSSRRAGLPFTDATLATLNAGGSYRVGFAPQGAGTYTLPCLDVLAAGDFGAYPGGADFSASSRSGSGDWTDLATRRLFGEVELSDLSPAPITNWFRGGGGFNGGFNG